MKIITDIDRINFIEERARFARLGVSFGWDGSGSGIYKYLESIVTTGKGDNVRQAIDEAINNKKWSGK